MPIGNKSRQLEKKQDIIFFKKQQSKKSNLKGHLKKSALNLKRIFFDHFWNTFGTFFDHFSLIPGTLRDHR